MVMRRDRPPKLPQRETFTIQYGFVYNEVSNAIEVNYSFKDGIIHTVSARFPPQGGARRQRTQITKSTTTDLREKASGAENLFSQALLPAIERTVFESIHLALFKRGIGIENNPRAMVQRIERWHRNLIADGVTKRGARKGSKQSKVTIGKSKLRLEMSKIIDDLARDGEKPSRNRVAQSLHLANSKALDRLRALRGDHRPWRLVVAEAVNQE